MTIHDNNTTMKQWNNRTILSIETSCDETGIALVKKNKGFGILSNVVASQVKIHEKFGGVYPSLAKREHQKNLVPVLTGALEEAKLLKKSKCQNPNVKSISKSKCQKLEKILEREEILLKQLKGFLLKYQKPEVEAIAVTIGPGLEPCLWVGVNFAKALGGFWDLPIIPINHLEAHVIANFIGNNFQFSISNFQIFPAVCLIVSGGHTQLVLMRNFGKYEVLGETRDDAAGECFDKTARVLGLGYPGGPAIASEAAKMKIHQRDGVEKVDKISTIARILSTLKLPRPMINQKNYDFSFSGLKTAVLYDFKKRDEKTRKSKEYIQAMAQEIQQAIVDVLVKKTIKATKDYKVKTIMLGGGVSANQELREQLAKKIEKQVPNAEYLIPSIKYCTDNAAMIGITAFHHLRERKSWKEIKANANLRL